jgi:hypothetical protein
MGYKMSEIKIALQLSNNHLDEAEMKLHILLKGKYYLQIIFIYLNYLILFKTLFYIAIS